MKYDPQRVAMPCEDPAHSMPHLHAIAAARALHRSIVNREYDAASLVQRHDDGPRLPAGPLFREHEFPAREILCRLREQEGDLQRDYMFSVQILMQAVVIAFSILQQERRRPGLAGAMTAVQEFRMIVRITNGDAHHLVPAIGDAGEARIKRSA